MYYLWNTRNEYSGVCAEQPQGKRWTEIKPPFTSSGKVRWCKDHWMVSEELMHELQPQYMLSGLLIDSMYIPIKDLPVFTRTGKEPVTVLIPCYKQEKTLRDSILSVLKQDYGNVTVEVSLMYDEQPTDSQKKFASYLEQLGNVKVFLEPRTDVAETRNRMVKRCPTEWFIMLDGDEALYSSAAVRTLVHTMGDVVFPRLVRKCRTIIEPFAEWKQAINLVSAANILYGNMCCLINKTIWDDVGGMDVENFSAHGEDTDFMLRLLEKDKYQVRYTNVPRIGLHERTASRYYWEYQWQIYSKHIDYILKCLRASGHSLKILKAMEYFQTKPTYDTYRALQPIDYQKSQDQARFILEFNDLIKQMNKRVSNYNGPLVSFDNAPFLPITEGIDAVFFVYPYTEKFQKTIPALIRVDWCKSIESMNDAQRMKWCMEHGKCTFVYSPVSVPVSREESEFYRLWCGNKEYTSIEIDTHTPCKGKAVSFILNKACNKKCAYCNSPADCNKLTYEQMYENFDKALTYVESKHPNNVHPQILGGEPTLWPDWFVQKIQDRLRPYGHHYMLFTNGYNRDSKWYTGINKPGEYQWHITDWHNISDIKPLDNENPHIVVTKQDLPYLDDFLMKFTGKHKDMFIQACTDAPGYELNDEERQYLSTKLDEYGIQRNPITGRGMTQCRWKSSIWYIDCDTMKISTCQDPGNWAPLEEIDQLIACSTCKGCQVHRC